MKGIGRTEIDGTVTLDDQLDVGDEIQLPFRLKTFAKLKLNGYDSKGNDIENLSLLADFFNSFTIVELNGFVVVPTPDAIMLMGSALLGLMVLRRRKV